MNKVYLVGTVANEPRLVHKEGNPAHLVLSLLVKHRSKTGGKTEYYPVNAWNQAAEWGAEQLTQGQRVLVDGYLTQQARPEGVQVQVTATRFYPQAQSGETDTADEQQADEPSEAAS